MLHFTYICGIIKIILLFHVVNQISEYMLWRVHLFLVDLCCFRVHSCSNCQFYSLENCCPLLLFLVPVFSVLFGRKSHLRSGDLCFKGGACKQTIWNSAWEMCILHHLFIHSIVYIGVNSQVHNLYCDL